MKSKKIYITICGMNYRHGNGFVTDKMLGKQQIKLVKDPDNDYDQEAIKATMPGLGTIGYVANSIKTVGEGCYSAGRLYDKIGKKAWAVVEYRLENGTLVCSVVVGK